MIINHNLSAIRTLNQLTHTSKNISTAMERLSSGRRINRAADDAAGLAISEKMKAQIRGVAQAQRNVQDGISLIQTAEGALNEVHSILQRMRELSVQAANDTNTTNDRESVQEEMHQLAREVSRIGNSTEFNTKKLLRGDGTVMSVNSFQLQIGPNSGQSMSIEIKDMRSLALNLSTIAGTGTSNGYPIPNYSGTVYYESIPLQESSDSTTDNEITLSVSSNEAARSSIAIIDNAISIVSKERSKLGAYQNRLEHTYNNLGNYQENLTASQSRIADADIAKEMMEFTRNSILNQAAQAMIVQANQQPQAVLQLLRQ